MTGQDGNDSLDFYRNIAAFTLITALDAHVCGANAFA